MFVIIGSEKTNIIIFPANKILSDSETCEFMVCGVYQDVTSGGKTAKATYDFPGEVSEKYTYQLELSRGIPVDEFANEMRMKLGSGYSIKSMDSFLDQTLGGVTSGIRQAVTSVVFIGMVITVFIVLLFMELRLARTMHALAEKLTMGIPLKDICLQELYPMLFLGSIGVISGVVLTELIGEAVVSALFSMLGLGITSISFSEGTFSCMGIPAGLVLVLVLINLGVCMKIKKIDITHYFNQ